LFVLVGAVIASSSFCESRAGKRSHRLFALPAAIFEACALVGGGRRTDFPVLGDAKVTFVISWQSRTAFTVYCAGGTPVGVEVVDWICSCVLIVFTVRGEDLVVVVVNRVDDVLFMVI
jgi:hypothetical protein